MRVFEEIADTLADPTVTNGEPKQVAVVIE
jgi:hypothetical protein